MLIIMIAPCLQIADTNQFIGECFLNQGMAAEARAMFLGELKGLLPSFYFYPKYFRPSLPLAFFIRLLQHEKTIFLNGPINYCRVNG